MIDPRHQQSIIWVSFRPGGTYPFFGAVASPARDQLIPLEQLWGADGATLRERLLAAGDPAAALRTLQGLLAARAADSLAPDRAVSTAAALLERGYSVAQVSDRLGWTPRQLRQRFSARAGLTPKRFGRLRRFQRLLTAVNGGGEVGREVDWARLAAECGYHDQPHMIHDFQAFAAMPPTAYAPRSADAHNHVPVDG